MKTQQKQDRYTVSGNDDLEMLIAEHMRLIAEVVVGIFDRDDLQALILGGAYGRGEGGVCLAEDKQRPFNDYDLFVIVRDISRKKRRYYQKRLDAASKGLTLKAGLDVDFGPLKTVNELRNMDPTLMVYDLRSAHKVIIGNADILREVGPFDAQEVPLTEALRMLLNRSVGLILSRQRLSNSQFTLEDEEFVSRNIFKAILGIGDFWLLMEGEYNPFLCQRLKILNSHKENQLLSRTGLYDDYANAVQYKLNPFHAEMGRDELLQWLEDVVFEMRQIYYEGFGRYFGVRINDSIELLELIDSCNMNSRFIESLMKNFVLNIRYFGIRSLGSGWKWRHPRQRLYYTLPWVLFDDQENDAKLVLDALGLRIAEDKDLELRFLELWEEVN